MFRQVAWFLLKWAGRQRLYQVDERASGASGWFGVFFFSLHGLWFFSYFRWEGFQLSLWYFYSFGMAFDGFSFWLMVGERRWEAKVIVDWPWVSSISNWNARFLHKLSFSISLPKVVSSFRIISLRGVWQIDTLCFDLETRVRSYRDWKNGFETLDLLFKHSPHYELPGEIFTSTSYW